MHSDKLFLIRSDPDISTIENYLIKHGKSGKMYPLHADDLYVKELKDAEGNTVYGEDNIIIFDVDGGCLKNTEVSAFEVVKQNHVALLDARKLFVCLSQLSKIFETAYSEDLIHESAASLGYLYYSSNRTDADVEKMIAKYRNTQKDFEIKYMTVFVLATLKSLGDPPRYRPELFKKNFNKVLSLNGHGNPPEDIILNLLRNLFGASEIGKWKQGDKIG